MRLTRPQDRGFVYILVGLFIGAVIFSLQVFWPLWWLDEVMHALGGVGIAFIVIGLTFLFNTRLGVLGFIVSLFVFVGGWEVIELVWKGRWFDGTGYFFWVEDTLLDMFLAVTLAFITREIIGTPGQDVVNPHQDSRISTLEWRR
jgi:hypothetical protein